jgi:hypothetical protein
MSTTPTDSHDEAVRAAEHWRELEGRTACTPEIEDEPQAPKPGVEERVKTGQKSDRSRCVRLAAPVAVTIFAALLAWIIVPVLVGSKSTGRSRSEPGTARVKARKAGGPESSRARWLKEPSESPPREGGPTKNRAHHAMRHPHSSLEPPRAASPSPTQIQPPAPVTSPPRPATEPSATAPSAPSEPERSPRPRDGATESTEFGL